VLKNIQGSEEQVCTLYSKVGRTIIYEVKHNVVLDPFHKGIGLNSYKSEVVTTNIIDFADDFWKNSALRY
jgi:hypothetical protein